MLYVIWNGKMAAKRADVFLSALILLILFTSFCIKKESFITNDGISVTFKLENGIMESNNHIMNCLFLLRRKERYTFSKTTLVLLFVLLAGDIELNPGPTLQTLQEDIKSFTGNRGLKMLHQNIRGLSGKFDQVKTILTSNNRIDIFGVTETFLDKENFKKDDFEIEGYVFETRHRESGQGGRVGVYIRNGIDYKNLLLNRYWRR